MTDSVREGVRRFLRDRDRLRGAVALVVAGITLMLTLVGVLASVLPAAMVQQWRGALVLTALVLGVSSVLLAVVQTQLAPREFFALAYAYDELLNDNGALLLEVQRRPNAYVISQAFSAAADIAQNRALDRSWHTGAAASLPRDDLARVVGQVLSPVGTHLRLLFGFAEDEYSSISVYLLNDAADALVSVWRKRNWNEDEEAFPSRSWAPTAGQGGGHIGQCFQVKRTLSAANIWKAPTLHDQARGDDQEHYTAIVTSPIMAEASEGQASARVTGVVCITSSREAHFEGEFDQSEYLTRIMAALLSPVLKGITVCR